ncbi:hypothetical protein Pisl_0662 [Pyrobaculum islandicum DSM 4184]|uniref:Uncharacterized protein n=1 Tax=Pyrobaculum islandicum (strain DSM 4184 / JCM 9189 / GEO3) TaxID=384616 RepID=A1RSA8_PYRIL|nr:hypothetical protein [Pyrobaculum islandicum]ABL87840.1 hypothetical protein Pisl_0662 [Pyrobaculum islandicum DSM 4184]
MPGYEIFELYQRLEEDVVRDFGEAMPERMSYMLKLVTKVGIPVDTVVIDNTWSDARAVSTMPGMNALLITTALMATNNTNSHLTKASTGCKLRRETTSKIFAMIILEGGVAVIKQLTKLR